jgi:hypothetical protein
LFLKIVGKFNGRVRFRETSIPFPGTHGFATLEAEQKIGLTCLTQRVISPSTLLPAPPSLEN